MEENGPYLVPMYRYESDRSIGVTWDEKVKFDIFGAIFAQQIIS